VARRVDEVDLDLARSRGEGQRRHCTANGDAAAAFEIVTVGGGVAVIDATKMSGGSRLMQEPFGQRGLAGVYVGDDTEIE
jgi:hypothetical protein